MTDRQLKKLSRGELLELLLEQMDRCARLEQELEQAKRQLQDRQIRMEHAGSIAEAALALNGVFEAADRAAREYLESVKNAQGQQL